MVSKKIQIQLKLADIVKNGKALGKVVGFTNGCFDILHRGHIRYLTKTKKECDILVVGVNSDASVKSIKGPDRPVNDQESRLEVLAALENIDYLTLFDEDTPEKLIKKLTPDIIFKGGDWGEEDIVGAGYVKAHGGKVRVIPYVEGYSTTDLIEKLRKDTAGGREEDD